MKKDHPFFVIFLVLFFALISISSLYGQNYQSFRNELDYVLKYTKLRIGPFRIFPTFNFYNVGYDNNVYYQREEDKPVSDYTAAFSPQIKTYLLFRNKLIFSVTENPEYVYYYEQKRERRWNNTLSSEVKLLLLNRFVISGGYLFRDRRLRASSEFDVKANEIRESYRASFFYETPRRTSFGISASSDKVSYEDIALPEEEIYLSRDLNREEISGHFEFYYRIFSESLFFISGGYSEYKFEHPQSRWRDSYSYQALSGIRFPLFGGVRGAISLGYRKLLPKLKEKKGFSGFVGNTSITLRIMRFSLRFQYIRDFRFSYWTDSIYYIEDRYGSGISFYLTRFLRLDYNFLYGEAKYPEVVLLQFPDNRIEEIKRKDIYLIHSAGVVFRIFKNTGIGVMVNFWERESNYYWVNRNKMFLGGYITYEF
ncbi:MAG: outer membrane beta-barrel protein [Candidatus Hodarchaeales archaeon]|jgi:hypothetical protein